MNTYIIKEDMVETYYNSVIKNSQNIYASKISIDLLGLEPIEVEEAKKKAKVGELILFEYDGKVLPFQVVHKYKNGDCVLSSKYVLENHTFDEKSNVWRDSSLRKYMNGEMLNKFPKELVDIIKTRTVHTEDYTTEDKLWLPSHEEIGYEDKNNMFKKNKETEVFDFYK